MKIVIELVDIGKWLSCATARACRHVIVKPSIASTFDRKLYKRNKDFISSQYMLTKSQLSTHI